MLNNVLYADLTGVFLVVGCTLFISLVNCLSEIPNTTFSHKLYKPWSSRTEGLHRNLTKHMGPRKWRISFTTTLFLPLTEIKAEMFPKMSM